MNHFGIAAKIIFFYKYIVNLSEKIVLLCYFNQAPHEFFI